VLIVIRPRLMNAPSSERRAPPTPITPLRARLCRQQALTDLGYLCELHRSRAVTDQEYAKKEVELLTWRGLRQRSAIRGCCTDHGAAYIPVATSATMLRL
jgi:hypothetical protein